MSKPFKILVVNDNYTQRQILKNRLKSIDDGMESRVSVHTSTGAIEGLGYLFITKPDLVIIDSTLPEFSGMELAAYLDKNLDKISAFTEIQVIITHRNKDIEYFSEKYLLFDKSNPDFLTNLVDLLRINFIHRDKQERFKSLTEIRAKKSKRERFIEYLCKKAFYYSNKSESAVTDNTGLLQEKIFKYSNWLRYVFLTDVYFIGIAIFGKDVDENIKQKHEDLVQFRVNYYPKIFFGVLAIVILLIQVAAPLVATNAVFSDIGTFFTRITNNTKESPSLVIKIIDANGNPVPNANVSFDQKTYISDNLGEVKISEYEEAKTYFITAESQSKRGSGSIKVQQKNLEANKYEIVLR